MTRQSDTDERAHFQTSRFFNANGAWYFATREGDDHGPFESLEDAEEQLDVYLFTWEQEGDITNMATASSFTNPARYEQAKNLTLKYAGESHDIKTDTMSYILGRGKDCELVVNGDLISRYHSKIEHRRGKFIITDQSTNGTFIRTSEGQDIFLRREEFTLFGSGYISLGKKVDLDDENVIHFYCE